MRIRAASWITAAIFLIVFCWLGHAAEKFAELFEGMGLSMPTMTGMVSDYGMIACPILGIVAATSLILTDKIRSGYGSWVQPILITFYAMLIVIILYAILPPFVTVTEIALSK